MSDKDTDAVHIDEIIDFLGDEGYARPKKLVQIILERLVNTNFLRKVGGKHRYYRTKDITFEQTVDWKKLITTCMENMTKHYPEVAAKYSGASLHKYTDPLTGERKDIPMTMKIYGGKDEA